MHSGVVLGGPSASGGRGGVGGLDDRARVRRLGGCIRNHLGLGRHGIVGHGCVEMRRLALLGTLSAWRQNSLGRCRRRLRCRGLVLDQHTGEEGTIEEGQGHLGSRESTIAAGVRMERDLRSLAALGIAEFASGRSSRRMMLLLGLGGDEEWVEVVQVL